ncbi:MAG: hypothetical protein Q7S57_00805 [bacterium]|nr:hypothetical protein [bacterium]
MLRIVGVSSGVIALVSGALFASQIVIITVVGFVGLFSNTVLKFYFSSTFSTLVSYWPVNICVASFLVFAVAHFMSGDEDRFTDQTK